MSAVSYGRIDLATILRVRDMLSACSEDDPELFTGEVGHVCGFKIYTTGAFDVEASVPRPITHGPQRKGRGGKVRRW